MNRKKMAGEVIMALGLTIGACVAEPRQAMRLEIDAAQTGPVISPLLFGHNLEHTRRAIWHGISAEMIANRKFAAADCGLPMRWTTLGGSGVAIDGGVAYAGRHSVRLENTNAASCGIWQQHDWLAFGKGVKYAFRVWARSDAEQKLQLRIVNRSGFNAAFSGEAVIKSGGWQLWRGEFVSPLHVKGGRLEIQLKSGGPLWIGAVSLMPADNFHGMRRDVVDLFKQLKPGVLRWPGGCFAECYDWKEGLLPVDQRPPIGPGYWVGLLPDTDGYDNHEIGTDEFLALCHELRCAPAITIRYGGGGSPEEAAGWVEYCNGARDTRWGRVRAERGHPEPYGVKYWYVGNEIWGMCLVKNKDLKVLSGLSRQFTAAMMKSDPEIAPIRCADLREPAWQSLIVQEIAGSPAFPELVQSGYYGPEDAGMDRMAMAPGRDVLPGLLSLRNALDGATRGKKRVGMVFYEWNVMWDRPGDVISGVFAAGMLNMFCREADALGLELTGYFQPVTEGAIRVKPAGCELEPDGQVFALYAAHQGNRLLKLPAAAADADLDVCASLAPDAKRICVTVINRSVSGDRTLALNVAGLPVSGDCQARILVPRTLEAGDAFEQRDERLSVSGGGGVAVTLPRCAVARLLFSAPL